MTKDGMDHQRQSHGGPALRAAGWLAAFTLSAGICHASGDERPLKERLFELNPGEALLEEDAPAGAGGGIELIEGLLLPGLNQARRGAWLRAGVFFAVEAGALAAVTMLNRRGEELDREFRAYADAHWEYGRLVANRRYPGEFAMEEPYLDPADLNDPDADVGTETGAGSHVLPGFFLDGWAIDDPLVWIPPQNGDPGYWDGSWNHFAPQNTQQFYEMIGKYGQFQRGWADYGADEGFEFPHQRPWDKFYFPTTSRRYDEMRDRSNAKLIAADRWLGVVAANHVLSFLDVLIRKARRRDTSKNDVLRHPASSSDGHRRSGLDGGGKPAAASLGLSVVPLRPGAVPVNALRITWSF